MLALIAKLALLFLQWFDSWGKIPKNIVLIVVLSLQNISVSINVLKYWICHQNFLEKRLRIERFHM